MQGLHFAADRRLPRQMLAIAGMLLLLMVLVLGTGGQAQAQGQSTGAVYVMDNDSTANAVLVFEQAGDGTLTQVDSVATGGLGTGGGLGSQGAIALSQNRRWLFVVNAGSNEISSFEARGNTLSLIDTVPSGGEKPVSLTVHGQLLYVLNAGGSGNITGFRINSHGNLKPIPNSTQYLSNDGVGDAPGPAQISFLPYGRRLVVTEKATNQILTYRVKGFGRVSEPVINASEGMTPFGFDFTPRGDLLVSEAFGGADNASAVSSYSFRQGETRVISSSVPTTQTAACWLVVSRDGKYAYTTNTGSSSVTGLQINHDGSVALLDADGVTGETGTGSRPIDAIFDRRGDFLYVLSGGSYTVTAFQVEADGSLINLGEVSVPAGSVGIVSR
ncbi:MAG: beta-propeller fold lactonase family protein [Chloroflexota bacterium]